MVPKSVRQRRRHTYPNPETKIQSELEAEIGRYVDILANELGPAAGAETVSDAEKVRMWDLADPIVDVDPEAFKQQLMTGGLAEHPEMLDPNNPQSLGIVRAFPEMVQVLSEPVDEQMADQIMRYCRWPLRSKVLEEHADDPEGWVKEANRMERLSNGQSGGDEAPEESPEEPMNAPVPSPSVAPPQAPVPTSPMNGGAALPLGG